MQDSPNQSVCCGVQLIRIICLSFFLFLFLIIPLFFRVFMNFSFYTANEIVFGAGKIAELPQIALRFGRKVFLCVRGQSVVSTGMLEKVKQSLTDNRMAVLVHHPSDSEPTVAQVDQGVDMARHFQPDVIIGLGGGSTMDTAKAIAIMLTHSGSVAEFLEGVGVRKIDRPGIPFIAVPTTAGTGAEVTKNAVISDHAQKYKKSMRSNHMLARVALLDPELTFSLPASITAETGMDAFTQLIESYISNKAQPIPQALALAGVSLVDVHLRTAVRHGRDGEAREAMMLASLLSGICLANSGLGAVHGIAAALGAVCEIAHGRACAVLLPYVLEFNLPACISAYSRLYAQLSDFSVDSELAAAEAFVSRIERLTREIGIAHSFSPAEVAADKIPELITASFGSSMSGNPVPMQERDVEKILKKAIGK